MRLRLNILKRDKRKRIEYRTRILVLVEEKWKKRKTRKQEILRCVTGVKRSIVYIVVYVEEQNSSISSTVFYDSKIYKSGEVVKCEVVYMLMYGYNGMSGECVNV